MIMGAANGVRRYGTLEEDVDIEDLEDFCRQPGWFGRRTRMERYLMLAATTVVFVVVALAISLAAVIYGYQSGILHGNEPLVSCKNDSANFCMTAGCVRAAAGLGESMDTSVDPCTDFFKFACGGFLKKKIIPDEKTSLSRFNEISDELREKLRGLVEAEESEEDTPSTKMVKALYKSCMNTDRIKERGLAPLKEILAAMGGWPVLEGDKWDASGFQWNTNVYINRKLGYSLDYIFDFSVTTNIKNSTWRIIDVNRTF